MARPSSPDPGTGSYHVHWLPAGAIPDDDSRRAVIEKELANPADPECERHVWMVDAEKAEWEELLTLVYKGKLPGVDLPRKTSTAHKGIILFLSTRALESWDTGDEHIPEPAGGPKENDPHETLKRNEFVIRVLISHGLGRLVRWDPEEESRLPQELQRFRARTAPLEDLYAGLRQVARDLKTIKGIARKELAGKPWIGEIQDRLSATVEHEIKKRRGKYTRPVVAALEARGRSVNAWLGKDLASDRAFAAALRAVYQMGRRPHVKAEKDLGEAVKALGERGSILARRDIDLLVTAHAADGSSPDREAVNLLLRLEGRLWAYEILRDLAYWLAYAANEWGRRLAADKVDGTIRVLILDEVFHQAELLPSSRSKKLADDLSERLGRIRDAFRGKDGRRIVHFDRIQAARAWRHLTEHVDQRKELKVVPLFPDDETSGGVAKGKPPGPPLFAYDLILVEVEFRGDYVGPAIVEKLNAYLEHEAHAHSLTVAPAIIVLSQTDNFSHVQQCLNLGAAAFVRKERMYELPMRVIRARIKDRAVEPQGQKANFRALYALPHEDLRRLQSTDRDDRILGLADDGQERAWLSALPKADLHTHLGTFIDLRTIQALAFNTVGHLLDRRAGNDTLAQDVDSLIDVVCRLVATVAHLRATKGDARSEWPVVRAMEILFPKPKGGDEAKRDEPPFVRLVAQLQAHHLKIHGFEVTAMLVAVLALAEERFAAEERLLPCPLMRWQYLEKLQAWLAAAAGGAPSSDTAVRLPDAPSERRKGELYRWLFTRQRALDRLLAHIGDQVSRRAGALRTAAGGVRRRPDPDEELDLKGMHDELVRREARLGEREHIEEQLFAAARWSAYQEARRRGAGGGGPFGPEGDGDELRRCVQRVARRVPFAWWKLNRRFVAALQSMAQHPSPGTDESPDEREARRSAAAKAHAFLCRSSAEGPLREGRLSAVFDPLTLQQLVVIPGNVEASEKTLLRYLWGTPLLGADHLQYPENLLLAARSVARQSAAEKVWYTELRCETVGYTEGGMVAVDATDLLCMALDLAVAYGVDAPDGAGDGDDESTDTAAKRKRGVKQTRDAEERWVRFNVLLGAKRHKSVQRFRETVGLAVYYMQQREEEEDRLSTFAPIWWKPSTVAGFDLSGDENSKQERRRTMMKPLFKYSTPVTIHAGEAADAESIWKAVYMYGARRIGHGLRLRENRRLLNHCISERLCMELCPISNAFTNSFPKAQDDYESDWWEYYPLRYYMEQGLDVCINTDNRQLHPHDANTLTDEYLCAARLAGGLSRWDVLRIVKAGFKHAFLPKREIGVLLRAVESEVYALVTDRT